MAARTPRINAAADAERSATRREARLAELVAELASCEPDTALDAVRAGTDMADPLELVARAMTDVRHRVLEPQDRLRVAGFLRAEPRRLPRRTGSATALAERHEDAEHHLVHHGSLRRWERSDAASERDDEPAASAQLTDGVIDLRDRTARFRRPDPAGEG